MGGSERGRERGGRKEGEDVREEGEGLRRILRGRGQLKERGRKGERER